MMFKQALGAASLALSVYAESEHMETMQRFFGDFSNAFLVEHAPVETQEVGKYLLRKKVMSDDNCHKCSQVDPYDRIHLSLSLNSPFI